MLDLALAKHFAFLLSPDVPESAQYSWWLVKGRPAYRYWSYLNAAEVTELSKPHRNISVGKLQLALPKALDLTLSLRSDVVEKFSTYPDPDKAMVGWFFAMGMKEHLFNEIVDLNLLRQLDQSVMMPHDGKSAALSTPAPTLLMFFIWHMLDATMQQTLALESAQSRARFLAWFFCNALEVFQLHSLLANRWKSWLQEPMQMVAGLTPLPRFAVLANSLMKEEERPNIKTAEGLKTMQEWAQKQLDIGGQWHWLISKGKKELFPFPRFIPAATDSSQIKKEPVSRPFGLNLIGFAFGELGIGEDLRMAVAACEAAGIPYRVVNIKPGNEIRQEDFSLKTQIEKSLKEASYAINVFIMPGFDLVSRIFLRHGDAIFKDHYNIGWWPWELSVWPKAWSKAFDLVDEIWAGSEFSHAMYQGATAKPTMLMPLAASVGRVQHYSRSHFGLPENPQDLYLFLYVFDFNSHLKRKNPEALIAAFQKTFPINFNGSPPVGLVLKVMNTKPKDPTWLAFEKLCKADPRIEIINQTLDREEILGLIQVCDAYVSPHRAEGFGRTLAEAMLFGKPVVATNFSGNAMFMNPQVTLSVKYTLVTLQKGDYHFINNADQAQWAEPDFLDLCYQMRMALERSADPQFSQDLKSYAENTFAPIRTGQLMKQRLVTLKSLQQGIPAE